MTLAKILGVILIMLAVATYNEFLQARQSERRHKNLYPVLAKVDSVLIHKYDSIITFRR